MCLAYNDCEELERSRLVKQKIASLLMENLIPVWHVIMFIYTLQVMAVRNQAEVHLYNSTSSVVLAANYLCDLIGHNSYRNNNKSTVSLTTSTLGTTYQLCLIKHLHQEQQQINCVIYIIYSGKIHIINCVIFIYTRNDNKSTVSFTTFTWGTTNLLCLVIKYLLQQQDLH